MNGPLPGGEAADRSEIGPYRRKTNGLPLGGEAADRSEIGPYQIGPYQIGPYLRKQTVRQFVENILF